MTHGSEVIPPLIEALGDSDAGVRAEAAKSLGLVAAYAARTKSDEDKVQAAIAALFQLLKDQAPAVRIEAMRAVGILVGSPPAGGGRGAQKGDGSAAPAKATVGPQQLADAFTAMLGDQDAEVRLEALRGLGTVVPKLQMEPPKELIVALEDQLATHRAAAIRTLAGFHRNLDPVIPSLLRDLRPEQAAEVRSAGIQALSAIKPPAISTASVPALVAALDNPDRDVRFQVLSLLARLGNDARLAALPAFITALKEPLDTDQPKVSQMPVFPESEGPVYVAAQVLGKTAPGTPSAGKAIAGLTVLVESGHHQRGAAAAAALAEFGPAAVSAVPPLIKLLKEIAATTEPTRDGLPVASALGRIAPGTASAKEAVKALAETLRASSDPTRESAIKALAQFGPKDAAGAIPVLRALQQGEQDSEVRSALKATLKSLGAAAE